jgi:N-methylhydantoinase B/oxoprolinase/acetone carboxylase alpha subunit
VIFRNDGRVEEIPSKIVTTLHAGDRILIETAGGGGHGPPQERAPESARRDVEDRKTRGD